MPMLEINTNLKEEDIQPDFLVTTSKLFQEAIGKPMEYISVHLRPDQLMAFGGTNEPCAFVNVVSAGKISPEENIKYTKLITQIMGKLGVPPDRMYIIFHDIPRDNLGFKGSILSDLVAKK
ncbi:macrophage migration inhibitory factor-like [Acanthaster planci]|uniref:L-dopachrome isomerase n=1 Tax=Acanthaster planci TaxID=133434 RepID=A0A8B7YKX5_ACAPL|nr:macrophage migration inhibitory factor-like [Acanthaster planci]XP_022093288.1 macrophage migration inhibitory factor-like [Acanthaster planci]